MCNDKVSIVHFHVLMSFYSIYAILSQIRFCRDLRYFCVNFWGKKLRLRNFLTNMMSVDNNNKSNCERHCSQLTKTGQESNNELFEPFCPLSLVVSSSQILVVVNVLFAIHPQNSCWLSWYHQFSRNQVNVWKVESTMGENENDDLDPAVL